MSTNSSTTESFVPVKAIINNMIELDSGFKVAGVKVAPKNIFIMEENEQFGVIDGLKDFYNTLDFEFWLVIADKKPGLIHLGYEITVKIVHHLSLIINSDGLNSNPLGASSFFILIFAIMPTPSQIQFFLHHLRNYLIYFLNHHY